MRIQRVQAGIVSRQHRLLPAIFALGGTFGCHPRTHATMPLSSTPVETSVWESPLHATPDVPLAMARQRYSAVTDRAGFELHSHYLYQTVVIPLVIRRLHAYVQADWSGRQVECLVDTGANTIMWPQWMHLDSRQLEFASHNSGVQGEHVRGEWMLSPRITIGDLHLTDVPTEAMGVPRPSSADAKSVDTGPGFEFAQEPILGIFAFLPAVTTIDYAHKTLTLRNIDYGCHPSVACSAHTAPALHKGQHRAGHPVRYVGWTPRPFSARYRRGMGLRLRRLRPTITSLLFPSRPPVRTAASRFLISLSLPVDIGGMKFKALTLYVVKDVGEADVFLGAALFRSCRVTIDPFRHVVLLESSIPRFPSQKTPTRK